jgi:C4-dicarboxylate-specific signal transduction histidine kinase
MAPDPDVSERELTPAELLGSAANLMDISQVAATIALTASLAHEISQPLSGVITNSNTCLRMLTSTPPDVAGAQETIRRTLRDVNRAAELITRLRATFGEREFERRAFDLNEAIREAMLFSSGGLRRNGVAVQSALADALPPIVGNRAQLELVIINLLRNASDAMLHVHNRARELLIKTEPEPNNRIRVTIRDTGRELLARAESLFRAAYSMECGDVGIALFVSRSIIERHQGRLWAARNEGMPGTTFSFSIPSAGSG